MKPRKGFKKITVNGHNFQYAVSFSKTTTPKLVVYNENDTKMIVDLPIIESQSWRGKHGDGAWGKKEVSIVLKGYICQLANQNYIQNK